MQVDDAVLMHEADSIMSLGGSWDDYRRWAQLRVDALNHALRGLAGGPRPLPRLLGQLARAARRTTRRWPTSSTWSSRSTPAPYAMEQANPRHEHEWRVWEDVKLPDGKMLIPGVVTHHTNVVEHPELVAQRLVAAGQGRRAART